MKVYFIGIAGAGMAALAQVYKGWGHEVFGSDTCETYFTHRLLERAGILVYRGFEVKNVPSDADLVIYSTAYNFTNPELAQVKALGLKLLTYPEALGELLRGKRGIAVCGTHGKTTTTAMIGLMLEEAGFDPTVVLGSRVPSWDNNVRVGKSDWVVIEADEYQNKLQYYNPEGMVLTTLDWDHPDFFPTPESYAQVFKDFINRLPAKGWLVAGADDVDVQSVTRGIERELTTYGWNSHRTLHGSDREISKGAQHFKVQADSEKLGVFILSVPGVHNASNALATIGVGLKLGIKPDIIRVSLAKFFGTYKRLEKVGEAKRVVVLDDFAHHPKEIQASLRALKETYPGQRIICLFQPHTYSRTKALLNEFSYSFADADIVLTTEIFASARETEKCISDDALALSMAHHPNTSFVPLESLTTTLRALLKEGDVLVTMGAGIVRRYGEEWLKNNRVDESMDSGLSNSANSDFWPAELAAAQTVLGAKIRFPEFLKNIPLAPLTTFRIGGLAKYFVRIKNSEEFVGAVTQARQLNLPILILAGGSNLLIADSGWSGLVIKVEDRTLEINGNLVYAGAGVPANYFATQVAAANLSGAEWLFTIPGTIGGAVRGNAGAFQGEIKDIVKRVKVWNGTSIEWLEKRACTFGYRASLFKKQQRSVVPGKMPFIILGAEFELQSGEREKSENQMKEFAKKKLTTQSLENPSAGCLFANIETPAGFWNEVSHVNWKPRVPREFIDKKHIPAGWLIDQLDLKGFKIGGAMVSNKHANYIVNLGNATAADVLMLTSVIKQKVRVKFCVQLQEEVEMVGF